MQGLQGPQGEFGPGAKQVVDGNGVVFGTFAGVGAGGAALVTLEHQGTPLAAAVARDGVVSMTGFPALYAEPNCEGQAYLPVEGTFAPLFRTLQVYAYGDAMAYYAGGDLVVGAFPSMSVPGQPATCAPSSPGGNWGDAMLVGQLRNFELSGFSAPFVVQ